MASNPDSEEIVYSGIIDREEYEEGVRQHYMPSALGQQIRLGAGILFVIFALASVFTNPDLWPNGIGILFFVAMINTHLWLPQFITSQQWRKNSALGQTIRGRVNETMISFYDQEQEEKLPWEEVIYFKSTENSVLLYQNRTAFSILTRSLFHSEADWNRFVTLVSQHVLNKKQVRRDTRAVIRQAAIWIIIIVVIALIVYNLQS